jgi:hypothetical protein
MEDDWKEPRKSQSGNSIFFLFLISFRNFFSYAFFLIFLTSKKTIPKIIGVADFSRPLKCLGSAQNKA